MSYNIQGVILKLIKLKRLVSQYNSSVNNIEASFLELQSINNLEEQTQTFGNGYLDLDLQYSELDQCQYDFIDYCNRLMDVLKPPIQNPSDEENQENNMNNDQVTEAPEVANSDGLQDVPNTDDNQLLSAADSLILQYNQVVEKDEIIDVDITNNIENNHFASLNDNF